MEVEGLRGLTEEIIDLRGKISDLTSTVDNLHDAIVASTRDAEILATLVGIHELLSHTLPMQPSP